MLKILNNDSSYFERSIIKKIIIHMIADLGKIFKNSQTECVVKKIT